MRMTMSPTVVVILFLSLLAAVLAFFRGHQKKRKAGILNIPPGSSGLPLVGETIQFTRIYPSTCLGEFVEDRVKKYGMIFRTHLLGKPTIISTDLEFNNFVLQNDDKLFYRHFPRTYMKLLGKRQLDIQTGELYHSVKRIYHELFSIPRLRKHFLADFEVLVLQILDSWNQIENAPILACEEMHKLSFSILVKNMLSLKFEDSQTEELRKLYYEYTRGLRSLPIDLPGTVYRKALQAKSSILRILERLIVERIRRKKEDKLDNFEDSDYLDMLINRSNLSNEYLYDHMLGMILAGQETLSIALASAIYYLGGCSKAIQKLRKEHLKVARKKTENGETRLSWEDYKQMTFTNHVIKETLRLTNVYGKLFRKTSTDIKFKGYDIPKGWPVLLNFAATHLDGNVYEEPQSFNPWRWKDTSTTKEMIDSYMPFSKGTHKCAAFQLIKMEVAIFLHHLVLKYDWQQAEPDEPFCFVGISYFPKGLPIKVHDSNILILK